MPTGWRPADVVEKYPVYKIDDVYQFEKYHTEVSPSLKTWLWTQLAILLIFVSFLFGNIAAIGSPGMFIYGLFIFLYVYAFAELMDNNPQAWIPEFLKCCLGLGIIIYTGNWFGTTAISPYIPFIIAAYLIGSLMLSVIICRQWKKETGLLAP